MKLISLNTWGGGAGHDVLLDFFGRNKDIYIFCLQEMWNGGEEWINSGRAKMDVDRVMPQLLREVQKILSEHKLYFQPQFDKFFGLAIALKKNLAFINDGKKYVYKESGYVNWDSHPADHARLIQYLTFETDRGKRTLINIHGLWNGGGKADSEDRILQSQKIIDFVKTLTNPFLLVGDFNLRPDTKSIKMFEDFGLRNLIKENGITGTRTSFYTKPERFADYIFASDGIRVDEFKILPDEVSDHHPMYLNFE